MNLTIDIGNTCAKFTVFDGSTPVFDKRATHDVAEEAAALLAHFRPERCAYSCVGAENEALDAVLAQQARGLLRVTGTTPAPITNGYRTPATLGADRLAAVVGATTLLPATNLLVVDAGTCITFDFVDAAGCYRGGNISPGVDLRFAALHRHTAHLPLVTAEGDCPTLGDDTMTAIRAGVIRGIAYEIEGYANALSAEWPGLTLFVTGGDRFVFTESLQKRIHTDGHLVARGLNSILLYNEKS